MLRDLSGRSSGGRVAGFGGDPGFMGSPEGEEAVVATAAVVEDGLRGNGDGGGGGVGEVVGVGRSIDMEWRKAEEAGELLFLIFSR